MQGLSNQGAQGIQGIESGQVTAKEYDVAVSSSVFTIDTVSQPDLYLIRGQKYTFDQSDSTNYNHPLELTLTNGSGYTNGWSSDGNMPADASTSGTRVHTFIVPYDAPDEIYYICNVHGSGMGNSIYISDLTASDLQGLQGLQGGGGQGTQGSQGFQGTQGVGSQGTQGTQGLGNQGLQGVQGLGVQGAAGTGGGSSGIEIENNGTSVGTGITSINFSTNVTATASGGIATVTASGGGGGGSNPWTRKTTTYTASAGDQLIADTSGGVYTITLPASPSEGDSIKIGDGADWATNNLTVARNGSNIEGSADDFILDLKGVIVEFVYEDSTDGWQVYSYTGLGGGIVVQEEGTNVGTAVTTLNFYGSSVTAAVNSGIASVTISGSGGGGGGGSADLLESMLFT